MNTIISVGIIYSESISFCINGKYTSDTGNIYHGIYTARKENDKIFLFQGDNCIETINEEFAIQPDNYETNDFELLNVTIGINFHWQREEDQKFKGTLKIINTNEYLIAINIIPLEDYLLSVISSEMSATSSLELLKAHAVISRSWLVAQKVKKEKVDNYTSFITNEKEYIKWYDREDHEHFDVCADDHCQRYQGITKAHTPNVKSAIDATGGEVLVYNKEVCDARFSKCCGGVTEDFSNTWEPVHHPYLVKVVDSDTLKYTEDLSIEKNAQNWILTNPDVFCNTNDKEILSNVLNDYDQETQDFFRWEVKYTVEEITNLVKERLDIDFGTIEDIKPTERGVSGRIIYLQIKGSKKTMTIGKELIIRKAFSNSHLYSSAFTIQKEIDSDGNITHFIFKGAGWGHGVGLCQIGAAVMSSKGYTYQEILKHYFPGAKISKLENINTI